MDNFKVFYYCINYLKLWKREINEISLNDVKILLVKEKLMAREMAHLGLNNFYCSST